MRISRHIAAWFAAGLAIWFAGCQTTDPNDPRARMPERQESRLFVTERADFMIIHGQQTESVEIRYRLRLSPARPIEQPMTLRVAFENPATPGNPVVQRFDIQAGTQSIQLESEPVWGLRAGEIYEVVIQAFDATGSSLGTHRQGVFSSIDTRHGDLRRGV